MSKKIYRETPLDNLTSAEHLDQLMKVTSAKGWLALLGIGIILLSAILWSFFGTLTTKVNGKGILLNNGGVYTIVHNAAGQVLDIRYQSGDYVERGSVIARIELPELVEEINSLEESKEPENQKRAEQLREELIRKSQIVSPVSGRILELNIQKGSLVNPGESLVVLEQQEDSIRLEAVLYVSAEQGAQIRPGMEAQISPATVNKEEYGFMLGRVTSVSDYPATQQSMIQTLGNDNLVSLLKGDGAPLKVEIELIPSADTISGYRWSSPGGPPMLIHSSTIIEGAVVIKKENPVSRIIPGFGRDS